MPPNVGSLCTPFPHFEFYETEPKTYFNSFFDAFLTVIPNGLITAKTNNTTLYEGKKL
jgi:hypothetical protein